MLQIASPVPCTLKSSMKKRIYRESKIVENELYCAWMEMVFLKISLFSIDRPLPDDSDDEASTEKETTLSKDVTDAVQKLSVNDAKA